MRKLFLSQKFFKRWHEGTFRKKGTPSYPLDLLKTSWLKSVLFNQVNLLFLG